MKKLILFILLFILLSCVVVSCINVSEGPEAPLQTQTQYIPTHDFTYKYELFDVIIKEHDYIFFRSKNTDLRHLIHNPDCRKCRQDNEEDLFSW